MAKTPLYECLKSLAGKASKLNASYFESEKLLNIIKVYDEMEREEANESMDAFINSLSKEQIIDLIEWRIDAFAESVNFILEPEYKAENWEGKVLERIEHLRRLIIESGDRGLADFAFVFIRQSINRRLLKEREKI